MRSRDRESGDLFSLCAQSATTLYFQFPLNETIKTIHYFPSIGVNDSSEDQGTIRTSCSCTRSFTRAQWFALLCIHWGCRSPFRTCNQNVRKECRQYKRLHAFVWLWQESHVSSSSAFTNLITSSARFLIVTHETLALIHLRNHTELIASIMKSSVGSSNRCVMVHRQSRFGIGIETMAFNEWATQDA